MRRTLASRTKKDVLHLIVADHDSLRTSIEVLAGESATTAEKKKYLSRFLHDLRLHSKTEEETFYDSLVMFKELRPQILEGFEEHNIADNLAAELESLDLHREWTDEVAAKSKVLAELIRHHMEEEESELFPEVRSLLTKMELENLGVVYLQKRKDIKHELEESLGFPSVGHVSTAFQHGLKGALHRVSSYVSNKFSPPTRY